MCMCTHMFMGTKTITIMEDAYNLLKAKKEINESFSDVIRRELDAPKKLLIEFAGKWKDRPEIKKVFNEIFERRHSNKWRGSY